jgi:hypothetical protein
MPFREWLVVLNGSQLEIRSRDYQLVENLEMPSFGVELDVSESGDAVVCLSPCGLAIVTINDAGTAEIVDYVEHGRWKYPQMGDGFFCVQAEELEEIHVFEITEDGIEDGPILDGYNPSVDGNKIAWLNDYEAFVWHVFSAEEPVLLQDNPYDLYFSYVRVLGNLCLSYSYGYVGRYFRTDVSLVDISAVGSGGSPEAVEQMNIQLRNLMAWNDEYLYLTVLVYFGDRPVYRLRIFNVTEPWHITYVGDVTVPLFSNIEHHDVISSNSVSFVCVGINFLEWWGIEDVQPQLIQKEYFPGYVSDLVYAGGVYDPIVWNAFDLPGEAGQRDWGYPFSEANLYPIIGDIDDMGRNESQVFYMSGSTPLMYYAPRMEEFFFFNRFWQPSGTFYMSLIRDYAIFHEGYLYKLERIPHVVISTYHYETVLERWDLSNLTAPEILFSFNVYEDEPFLRYGAIDNGFFIGFDYSDDGSKLHVVDLSSLEAYRVNLTLPSQEYPYLVKTFHEFIFILCGSGIYTYKRDSTWARQGDVELVSHLPLSVSNFIVTETHLLASNCTHFFSLYINSNGHLSIENSIILPMLTPPFKSHTLERFYSHDRGDILVNPENGLIYRAGGTLGVWVLEFTSETTITSSITTTTTSTTTTDFGALDNPWPRFILGTSLGIASIIILAVLARKHRTRL